jgi:hypothetical protein
MSTDQRDTWEDKLSLSGPKAAKLASWFNQICSLNGFLVESIDWQFVDATRGTPAIGTIQFKVSGPAKNMEAFQKAVRSAIAKATGESTAS